MATVFGFLAVGLGLVLSLNQDNLVVVGFMLTFTLLTGIVLVNQVRSSIREARYAH
ncbi:hypothetical protein ACFQMM_09820 [Saliphagus sp. GCM10025308]